MISVGQHILILCVYHIIHIAPSVPVPVGSEKIHRLYQSRSAFAPAPGSATQPGQGDAVHIFIYGARGPLQESEGELHHLFMLQSMKK